MSLPTLFHTHIPNEDLNSILLMKISTEDAFLTLLWNVGSDDKRPTFFFFFFSFKKNDSSPIG